MPPMLGIGEASDRFPLTGHALMNVTAAEINRLAVQYIVHFDITGEDNLAVRRDKLGSFVRGVPYKNT